MSVQHVNARAFAELVAGPKPVLVDFYADWCGPCRMLTPVLEEIAAEHPEIEVCKVNVDEERELAMQFGISSIPFVALVKEGRVAATSLGYRQKRELCDVLGL